MTTNVLISPSIHYDLLTRNNKIRINMYKAGRDDQDDYNLRTPEIQKSSHKSKAHRKRNKSMDKRYCLPQINSSSKLDRTRELNQDLMYINFGALRNGRKADSSKSIAHSQRKPHLEIMASQEKLEARSVHNSISSLQDTFDHDYINSSKLDKNDSFQSAEVQSISSVRSFAENFKKKLSSTASKALETLIPHNDYYSYNHPGLRRNMRGLKPSNSTSAVKKHMMPHSLKFYKGLREAHSKAFKPTVNFKAEQHSKDTTVRNLKLSLNTLKLKDFKKKFKVNPPHKSKRKDYQK